MSYSDLAEAIIQKEKGVMGDAALKAPRDAGIDVEDDGEIIKIEGDEREAVQKMVEKYHSYTGEVAVNLAKKASEDVDTEGLELPEILK
ncbi:MAG: hypothetical protein ABEJ87_05000 [Candidatus Nanohalobium sp.]